MPSLEEIMGSSYREDMTAEEVNSYFKSQLLSTGEYVSSEKAKADKAESAKTIQELQSKLQGNMSEEELRNAEVESLKAQIEAMKESQRMSKIETAKLKAQGALVESAVLMGIASDDKDYKKFLDSISDEDSVKTENVSKYVNKIIKEAYEKGKAEATKTSLGKMGEQYSGGSSDNEVSQDIDLTNKIIASKPKQKENKKSNFI